MTLKLISLSRLGYLNPTIWRAWVRLSKPSPTSCFSYSFRVVISPIRHNYQHFVKLENSPAAHASGFGFHSLSRRGNLFRAKAYYDVRSPKAPAVAHIPNNTRDATGEVAKRVMNLDGSSMGRTLSHGKFQVSAFSRLGTSCGGLR